MNLVSDFAVCCSLVLPSKKAFHGSYYRTTSTAQAGGNVDMSTYDPWRKNMEGKKTCNICGHMFSSNDTLKNHIRNVHEKRPYPCTKCGKVYRSGGSLHNHMNSAHGLNKTDHPF